MLARGAGLDRGASARGARRGAFAAALTFAAFGLFVTNAAAGTASVTDRYTIVQGCYSLQSASGDLVAQTGDGYSASPGSPVDAEAFRLQATDLGKYLFYGEAQDFLGLDEGPLAADDVVVATAPSNRTDWTVRGRNGDFTVVNEADDLGLAVADGGQVVSVPKDQAETFTFVPAAGCATYPEISLNTSGEPSSGPTRYGEVEGTVDGHMHMMAFEFLGGQAHCGAPWHKFGAPYALKDCVDHEPNGCSAALETGLGGDPCHNTGGWPDFTGWPQSGSLTHESSYYKWLERAHQGGLRVFVNLFVENRVLCEAYPPIPAAARPKSNCDEMDTVLRERKRIFELQDYIDAQEGGPGEGWFRIVQSPYQARKVINQGKLAVIQGMEVSEPFDCGYKGAMDPGPGNPLPDSRCSEAHISDWLDRLWDLGIRQMEITNKFDNQLTGVAGDGGSTGVVVNTGQFATSGTFWDFEPYQGDCDEQNQDRVPATNAANASQDEIFGNGLEAFLTIPNILPVYSADEKCNIKGLDPIPDKPYGTHAIQGIMDRRFVFDPDHMSVLGRDEALNLLEERDYPGIVSSHSWSTQGTLPRVYKLGGVVTPYAGGSSGFARSWEELKSAEVSGMLGDQYFGIGYGADANGFGSQGGPRTPVEENDVDYPFTGIDGAVTFQQQKSGTDAEGRTYDINTDGVDHYGLYPDWMEDLRRIKGDEITKDLNRGAEAYLQMWERTYGVPEVDCSKWGDEDFTLSGLGQELKLTRRSRANLVNAGQPVKREKIWRWCAGGGGRESALNVKAQFTTNGKTNLIISNLPQHEISGVAPGDPATELEGVGTKISDEVRISRTRGSRAFVWITDGATVTHTGVVSNRVTKRLPKLARSLVKVAGS